MKDYTKLGNPGTPLSAAAQAVATTRRGTGMRWSAVDWLNHGPSGPFAKTVVDGVARERAYVRFIDLPAIKQFRVPLSLRERSP